MTDIKLWSVSKDHENTITLSPFESLIQTETEEQLEKLIVENPQLLMDGLQFVGRQTPTQTGVLDLLGVDSNGYLVVFELKRGKLYKEAVTQIIDYASFLSELDLETLCKHISDYSGTNGVEKINDFLNWYQEQFGGNLDALEEPPKMVLVGLGYDENTKRMVNFLSRSNFNISIITFYGFQKNEELFLAKQVEISGIESRSIKKEEYTKANNEAILQSLIKKVGVKEMYSKITHLIKEAIPSVYIWPNRTCRSFYLPETTEDGRSTSRSYIALYLNNKEKKTINFYIYKRALDQNPDFFKDFISSKSNTKIDGFGSLNIKIKDSDPWNKLEIELKKLLEIIKIGWENTLPY